MPGIRDRNLRSGDLHEELGIFLLKAVALVAPVPRQEDVGNDAFATLIRPDGNRRLIPDVSFMVQLKSASIQSVSYTTLDEIAWIRELEVPLFIGRVDLKKERIELFTTLRLHQIVLEDSYDGIELLLDRADESSNMPNIRRFNLGSPIHAWSMAEVTEPEFLSKTYAVLRPHVDILRRNRLLRGIQFQQLLKWVTGEPPTSNGEMMLILPQNDITDTLRDMTPHARRLLIELQYQKRYGDFPVMMAFFDMIQRWGANPDPGGTLRMAAGCIAGGPEISIEEAIRIRLAYQPAGTLDLCDLPATDDNLAIIPNTITNLALKGSSITDGGVPHLLRLTYLKRLDIADTLISDDGFVALSGLPYLEWICINLSIVTAEGVERLKTTHPNIKIVIKSEPGTASLSAPTDS